MQKGRNCPGCGETLRFLKREDLQLGRTGLLLGDWPNILAGALEVDIWACPGCGRLEFYLARPEEELETDGIAQTTCEGCGARYDLDSPKCPRCGRKNANW